MAGSNDALKNKFENYVTLEINWTNCCSINLIVKNKNKLFGYNTDISAAIKSLQLTRKKNYDFGLGGTGKPL